MLASLLPGLRDLRTPLAAGYIWLISIWLLAEKYFPIDIDVSTGPLRSLYQLSSFLGSSAILAAISFIAYLAGSILWFTRTPQPSRLIRRYKLPPAKRGARHLIYDSLTNTSVGRGLYGDLDKFMESKLEGKGDLSEDDHGAVLPGWAILVEDSRLVPIRTETQYVRAITEDLDTVAIELQAKNRDFWDTYDRHSSEAMFRFRIAPPIGLLIIVIAFQSSNYWWLLLLLVPIFLHILGNHQWAAAQAVLVKAIVLEMVEPPVVHRLREYPSNKDSQ